TRRSNVAPMSCGSSPTPRAASGWCGHSRLRPTRTGSSSIATSTWTICANTRKRHCAVRPDPRPVQPSTVLARSRTLCAGSAGAAACAAASLTAAARGALPEGRSGRRDSRSDRTKGCCYWPELKSAPHHDQFAELDAHRFRSVLAWLAAHATQRSVADYVLDMMKRYLAEAGLA